MAESALHRSMKSAVRTELENDHYVVVEEPVFPPTLRISWHAYRPDLLAYRRSGASEEIAIVECETNPSMRRFASKNFASLTFQPLVLTVASIRRVLAIPRGKLRTVDLRLRERWEIWILGAKGPLETIPRLEGRHPSQHLEDSTTERIP